MRYPVLNKIRSLLRSEDGAVTIDWVVLTALIVGFGGAVIVAVEGGSGSVGTGTANAITSIDPDAGF
ncbi:MAG: hypothetical protein HEP69_02460 [Aestuariivita sp.]|jgi:Flp pilus assembly pilin Flp|nr:hypothetical protein [Aestuariivita sp.]